MIYEALSRETIGDYLKMGFVIAGVGQNSIKEHLLMSATKCDSWTSFVREIELIEHARKTITPPTPMELDAFHGNGRKCGTHCERMSDLEPWRGREASMCAMWKNIMDTVGQGATHHPTKSHREEDGKVTGKEKAREPEKA